MRDTTRLNAFLDKVDGKKQPETFSDISHGLIQRTIQEYVESGYLTSGMKVLDVRCGNGLALKELQKYGIQAHGLALGEDAKLCRGLGFSIFEVEQNFSGLDDGQYDFIWSRHALEESIMPMFTLSEYHRLLKPGGMAYIEVVAPDTDAHHERNPAYYSVLPILLWQHMHSRAGLKPVRNIIQHMLTLRGGAKDTYWSFLLQSE